MRVDAANGGQVEARGDEGGPWAILNRPNARLVVGDVASCRAKKKKKFSLENKKAKKPNPLDLPIHMAANLVDHPILGRRPLEHRQVARVVKGN